MNLSRRRGRPVLIRSASAALLASVLALTLVPATAAPPAPGGTSAVGASATAAAPAAAARAKLRPTVRFRDCGRFRCARVAAPLDYDRPRGARVGLAVLKVPARKPRQRIGTLFVNPGGPGGSATDFASYAGQFLGAKVRDRFDIVGVDPRGVGGTSALTCRGRKSANYPAQVYPRNPRQQRSWLAFDAQERRLCRGERIADHMTTADTARDMDWVRRALGRTKISYFGASYGTFLGATYAALYPQRMRAFVVDGVLDPVEWTTGRDGTGRTVPVTTRLGSGEGSRQELTVGLQRCDQVGRPACALAGDALARYDAVAKRLRTDPRAARAIDLSYDDLVNLTLGLLYGGDLDTIATVTRQVERALARLDAGSRLAEASDDLAAARRDARGTIEALPFPGPYGATPAAPAARGQVALDGAFHGVLCSDSVNPASRAAWPRAARGARERSRDFGPLWTWASSACRGWPGSGADAYRGGFDVPNPGKVLVVNNRYDPATPLTGAVALRAELGRGPSVVTEGFGHVATGTNACATRAVAAFLLTGRAASQDLACPAPPLFRR